MDKNLYRNVTLSKATHEILTKLSKCLLPDGTKLSISKTVEIIAKEKAKRQAHDLIKRFGWLVQRVTMDSSKTIPSVVTTYCAAIRTDCADICTAIDNAANMAAFKALYQDTYNSDGTVDVVARVNRWADDTNVQTYER